MLIAIAMGVCSLWLAGRDHLREDHLRIVLGIAGISCFFLAAVLVFLNRRMSLTITPVGILVPAMDPDIIPWHMILSAVPLRSSVDTQLRLELAPGYHPIAQRIGLPRGNERIAPKEEKSEWTIECADFHLSAARIAETIEKCILSAPPERHEHIATLPKRPLLLL
ncbi:MAG: hypothetical protein KF905_06155 [Flavobacteriales bacterium]|nr:hypothetical protein [Flavobacteriales bacterium]